MAGLLRVVCFLLYGLQLLDEILTLFLDALVRTNIHRWQRDGFVLIILHANFSGKLIDIIGHTGFGQLPHFSLVQFRLTRFFVCLLIVSVAAVGMQISGVPLIIQHQRLHYSDRFVRFILRYVADKW